MVPPTKSETRMRGLATVLGSGVGFLCHKGLHAYWGQFLACLTFQSSVTHVLKPMRYGEFYPTKVCSYKNIVAHFEIADWLLAALVLARCGRTKAEGL